MVCLLLTGVIGVRPGQACSTFVLRESTVLLLCTNFDHYTSNGLMSQYGSITFNQMGKEFPFGGMNEAGLAIALMWLDDTRYPEQDDRPIINILQWIQYQLDNFSSVEAVLQSLEKMRFSLSRIKLHFMICDRLGNSATVEFIDGKVIMRVRPCRLKY
jgi:choloylglycine hydrolase